ncbi:MAG: tRNA (guanosine(37)-N1)-methyltransferase TrmD [Arcanobacterium sp.]|nr:tRNA (guanosine(37)-N1)-methyltransferase TrmD [Arcanobacterium sp.]
MRFDIFSIFPEFFQTLELSLLGKAQQRGLISVAVHNLRDWTHDVHNSVDDTPFGGGAGMVMKAEVWGEAIDSVLRLEDSEVLPNPQENQAKTTNESFSNRRRVLAIPTPSGVQLTQRKLEDLAQADQLILACGRYEGIDSRVAQYYAAQEDVEVFEFSLGDYVLNGGEVAALALVEGVARLVPGMMGNPESLVEESHGAAGLLEYPVYTRPADFRGITVPEVLTSGNHGAIARWRRDQAIERTAWRRPDMLSALELASLDKKDRVKLAELGWFPVAGYGLRKVSCREAGLEDIPALSVLAAETFPDACPPELSEAAIAEFISRNLSEEAFERYLQKPESFHVFLAEIPDAGNLPVAYALCERNDDVTVGAPVAFTFPKFERQGQLIYLSKMYLARQWRGSGLLSVFTEYVFAQLREKYTDEAQPYLWLGTNQGNRRAQNAYKKLGFVKAGKREFLVGDTVNTDITMVRPLNMAK